MPNIPEKRTNPFEKTLNEMRDEQTRKSEEKTAEKVTTTKKTTSKSASDKATANKTTTKKTDTKTSTTKKTTTKKTAPKKTTKVKIDTKTGVAKVVETKPKKAATKDNLKKVDSTKTTVKKASSPKKQTTKSTPKKETKKEILDSTILVKEEGLTSLVNEPLPTNEIVETPVVVSNTSELNGENEVVKKPRKISKRAQLLKEQKAAERAAAKAAKLIPVEIVRPVPKKFKLATKEEKAQFKKLEESFDYLVNLASVVEEKTMDKTEIPDITLGELHVIQMVNKYNNKPMTLIANKLKVTVGSLITCLNRLIQKDYIIRTRDEMDNRVILLTVTPKAKKVLKTHDKFHDDILGLLLENGVTLAQATKVLATLVTTLEVYYDPIHNSFETKEKGSRVKKK